MTNDKLADMWINRDFPVLRYVAARFDADPQEWSISVNEVADNTGLSRAEVQSAAAALRKRGLIEEPNAFGGEIQQFKGITGDAYLVTGLHPNGGDAIEQLVSLLHQASDQAGDDDERSRLRRAASALTDASGKILTGVATAWMTGTLPH